VLRHGGAHGIFIDSTAFGTEGCWQDDCRNTDKFRAADQSVCARACAEIDECTHWTFGEQEGSPRCFLRKSDGGREEGVDGFVAAPKACAPPMLPDAQLALVSSELPALRVCDEGVSSKCPDMARAMRTWQFAIAALKRAADGAIDGETTKFVDAIAQDTDAFITQMSEENFPVVAGNNRQVFDALRHWLDSQPKADIDTGDRSLPNTLRGRLCGKTSCYE